MSREQGTRDKNLDTRRSMTQSLHPEPRSAGRPATETASRRRATVEVPQGWTARRLAPTVGLELANLFLPELDDEGIATVRSLLLKHRVLVFRRQPLTPAQHVAFARRFGELEVHPLLSRHPDHPELVELRSSAERRGAENVFHADTAFYEKPSMGSILHCIECPEVGGDTIFSNMVQAYAELPDEIKTKIERLTAAHDMYVAFGRRMPKDPEERRAFRAKVPPVEHPVVTIHPETGERILFVNEISTTHIANYREAIAGEYGKDVPTQMRELLDLLIRRPKIPEYQVRVKWEPDTVVFWDNRAVQHYAISDYYPEIRHMRRATIIGTRPTGPAFTQ
jgi:taurine dioxygenase